jgi:ATP-dependent helicase/nuclease subunit A
MKTNPMTAAAPILRRRPMSKTKSASVPPDQLQREQALNPARSMLVQAPAGSGKTDLLTRRFLRLLREVDDPAQIVAITFTIAAAAEMRHRILSELEKETGPETRDSGEEFSMSCLARRALDRSNARGWKLLDLPAQLRISTIDSFCRELALQQPLLSGLGGGLAIAEQPKDLYRRAARQTLNQIGNPGNAALSEAVEALLVWRDNNWQELEDLLVRMLESRDRWMHDFVLSRDPDWNALRERLERPFANAVCDGLIQVSRLLDQVPGAREEAMELARFACSQTGGELHRELVELAEFPNAPFPNVDELEVAHQAMLCLADLVLTGDCAFRERVDKRHGFPADRKAEKARLLAMIRDLDGVPGLEAALAAIRDLPPACYSEEDWTIVRACFMMLRNAAAQLKVVFAEAAEVDFIEVAQVAESVLQSDDGFPTDAAIAVADGIRHLLVDEFQDTSRRQHQLLARLIAAWPDRVGRTSFLVGDPMQSIYFFRDADAELFARVKEIGLEIPNAEPLALDFVPLSANFRTTPSLIERLNDAFSKVFAADDGSCVMFSHALPGREGQQSPNSTFKLHLEFEVRTSDKKQLPAAEIQKEEEPPEAQIAEIVDLICGRQAEMEEARRTGGKFRIAVLARARKSLAPIAQALHEAAIPFRAVDIEKLGARPEVLDALALAAALLNPYDRVAWLGVLRAPWCGLTLSDLHTLSSDDDVELLARPIPELLAKRLPLLSHAGRVAAQRVVSAANSAAAFSTKQPTASAGTWLEQIWLSLGGADCYDATAQANLDLLWACLDRLPGGQQDLLGPTLNAALDKLTALPDPAASNDCGVQLMTIHKSKGLEFEVVIVPDLQAKTAGNSSRLLSWMERGLKPGEEPEFGEQGSSGEITEFLVAPLQSKGEDAGKSKAWVDRMYRQREAQETRRILYVAATRARAELHLFVRPAYRVEANGDFTLMEPSASLLSTAWPAFAEEIRARFEEWKLTRVSSVEAGRPQAASHADIESIAAVSESDLFVMPPIEPPGKPTLLRRLPKDYRQRPGTDRVPFFPEPGVPSIPRPFAERVGDNGFPLSDPSAESGSRLYARHEGGVVSRALGTAVHALLEELARLRGAGNWLTARDALQKLRPRIQTEVRALGIAPQQAGKIAADALQITLDASHDPIGQWILSPHPEAATEVRWTGVVADTLTNVRVDRIFRAGLTPQSESQEAWWVIDYKTADADDTDPAAALARLRPLFAPQLEAYALVLRNLHGEDATIRAGLYYPRMSLLDWWEI